jgi:GMP synthase (glutamine-hydrolysing)
LADLSAPASSREYGHAVIHLSPTAKLFQDVPETVKAWASHGDYVAAAPPGFQVTATSENAPVSAMQNVEKQLYGLLFHPEVAHTERGEQILRNFAFGVCGVHRRLDDGVVRRGERRRDPGSGRCAGQVVCGLSGGVDSTVAACSCIARFGTGSPASLWTTDSCGRTKPNRFAAVRAAALPLEFVDASDRFLDQLAG